LQRRVSLRAVSPLPAIFPRKVGDLVKVCRRRTSLPRVLHQGLAAMRETLLHLFFLYIIRHNVQFRSERDLTRCSVDRGWR